MEEERHLVLEHNLKELASTTTGRRVLWEKEISDAHLAFFFKRMRINLEEMGQTVGKDLVRLFISPYKMRQLRCNF